MNNLLDLVRKLSPIPGVSGFEDRIIEVVSEELRPYVDSISADNIGNVIGVINGSASAAPKIMVDAHIDQPAMLVKYIEPTGFIRMERQGYPHTGALPAQRVLIHTRSKGIVKGVVGIKGTHFYWAEAGGAAQPPIPTMRDLYVDVGCESRDSVVEMGISIGDPITYDSEVGLLGPGKLIIGQAFDNRALVAVTIDALRRLMTMGPPDSTIYVVGSAMEELGLRGIRAPLRAMKPDMLISLDITICADTPDAEFRDFPVRVGKGPVITIADMIWNVAVLGVTAHPAIREHFIETASKEGIPYQLEAITGAISNASTAHEVGVPAGALKVATRYSHTASEVLSLDDLENCSKLLAKGLLGIGPDFSLSRPWKPKEEKREVEEED